jgi:general stress protein 26
MSTASASGRSPGSSSCQILSIQRERTLIDLMWQCIHSRSVIYDVIEQPSQHVLYKPTRAPTQVSYLPASSCLITFSSTRIPPKRRIQMYHPRKRLRVCISFTRRLYTAHILADLHEVIRGAQTGMLTTRASNGCLHARAMTPVGRELQFCFFRRHFDDKSHLAYSESQVNLAFIANNASPKCQELQNDDHVNVSFFDKSSTSWASFSGLAKVIEDRSVIKKHWSPKYAFGRHFCTSKSD